MAWLYWCVLGLLHSYSVFLTMYWLFSSLCLVVIAGPISWSFLYWGSQPLTAWIPVTSVYHVILTLIATFCMLGSGVSSQLLVWVVVGLWGCVWANVSFGLSWNWDVIEITNLLIIALVVVILHSSYFKKIVIRSWILFLLVCFRLLWTYSQHIFSHQFFVEVCHTIPRIVDAPLSQPTRSYKGIAGKAEVKESFLSWGEVSVSLVFVLLNLFSLYSIIINRVGRFGSCYVVVWVVFTFWITLESAVVLCGAMWAYFELGKKINKVDSLLLYTGSCMCSPRVSRSDRVGIKLWQLHGYVLYSILAGLNSIVIITTVWEHSLNIKAANKQGK